MTLTTEQLQTIRDGCEGVQKGPYLIMAETSYGDRSEMEVLEIWSDDNEVLIATEVRRAFRDGGRTAIEHFQRLDPDTVCAMATEILALREQLAAADSFKVSNDIDADTLTKVAPELYEALNELVTINEQHNAAIGKIMGTPAGWKDSYLDKARAALAKAEGKET